MVESLAVVLMVEMGLTEEEHREAMRVHGIVILGWVGGWGGGGSGDGCLRCCGGGEGIAEEVEHLCDACGGGG